MFTGYLQRRRRRVLDQQALQAAHVALKLHAGTLERLATELAALTTAHADTLRQLQVFRGKVYGEAGAEKIRRLPARQVSAATSKDELRALAGIRAGQYPSGHFQQQDTEDEPA